MKTLVLKRLSLGLITGLIAFIPALAHASTYGSGSYGACTYGHGCSASSSASSSTSSGSTASTTPQPGIILLNDFSDYFTDAGKNLPVSANQVIYFDVQTSSGTVRHSVTIQTVGPDYVDITIQSTPPTTDRINVGQTKQYDVDNNGSYDIQITLNSISNGQANLNFKQLGKAATTTIPTTKTTHHNYLWPIAFGAALLAGLGLFFWLLWKRRRNQTISTNQPS